MDLLAAGIERLVERLSRRPEVEKVILFGSRARGTNGDRSDVDLAVIAPSASAYDWSDMRDSVDEAKTLLVIDLVRFDRADPDLITSIENEGIALFGG